MSDEGHETMQHELTDLGVRLTQHPEATAKNLKSIPGDTLVAGPFCRTSPIASVL
jgi:hypothetical protein